MFVCFGNDTIRESEIEDKMASLNEVDNFGYKLVYNNDTIRTFIHMNSLWFNCDDVVRVLNIKDIETKHIDEIFCGETNLPNSSILDDASPIYVNSENLLNKLKTKTSKLDLYTFLSRKTMMLRRTRQPVNVEQKTSGTENDDDHQPASSCSTNVPATMEQSSPTVDNMTVMSAIQALTSRIQEHLAQRDRDRAEYLAQRERDRAEHLVQRTRDRVEYQSQLLAITDSMGALRQKIEGRRAVTVHNRTRPQDQECVTIMRCNVNPRKYYFIRAQYQSLPDRISTLQRDHNRFPAGLTLVKRLHSPNAVRLLKVLANRYHAYILRQDCCIIYRREQNTINGEPGWTERQMMQHIYDIYDNNVMERDTTSMPPLDDHDVLPLDEGEQRDYDQLYSDPHLLNDHDSFDDFDE